MVNKHKQKQDKEMLYRQLFEPYQPSLLYTVCFINRNKSEEDLNEIRKFIQGQKFFICDTEASIRNNQGTLIQILPIRERQQSTTVFLFEMNFLPSQSSIGFNIIQQILSHIFNNMSTIYTWGSLHQELQFFSSHAANPRCTNNVAINIQAIFMEWFNRCLRDNQGAIPPFDQSTATKLISHEQMNQVKISSNNMWSLQDAVVYLLHRYLSKQETLRDWGIGLDKKLSNENDQKLNNTRQQLVNYAVYDCFSVFDIMIFIYEKYSIQQQQQTKVIQSLHEYFYTWQQQIKVKKKKNKSIINMFLEDESDDDMADYASDDRCISSLTSSKNPVNANSNEYQSSTRIVLIDDEIVLTSESNDRHPSNEPQTKTQQNLSKLFEERQQQEYHQVNSICLLNENPSDATTTEQVKPKTKRKRSIAARKIRNQKSSQRHRRNRYKFEVIRPLNIPVTEAKAILKSMNINPDNVNPVNRTLYISLKDEQQQKQVEQMLRMNIFQ